MVDVDLDLYAGKESGGGGLYTRWTVCERCFVWCLDVSDFEHLGDTNAIERRW